MAKTYIADKETLDKVYEIVSADTDSSTESTEVTEKLDEIYELLSASSGFYGFIEHNATLSPDERIEYIGINADYTPMSINLSTGEADYGSWADFPIIQGCKPYMVNSDGTPDYQLDEDDYTLREDGNESEIADSDYDGGAFAWLPKIYKYEYMSGNDRIVKFSFEPLDGYEAAGFIDPDGNELEGVWIPMFYGAIDDDGIMRTISGTEIIDGSYSTVDELHTAITAFSDRAHFFGGPIVETIIDLMLMLGKSSNLQAVFGYGNSSGDNSLTNSVIGGGAFYGTEDGGSLNKVFHSVVLTSYTAFLRDPYIMVSSSTNTYLVSTDYTYSLAGEGYTDTGIDPRETYLDDESNELEIRAYNNVYPHKYRTVPGFGALPVQPYNGSTTTGGCDTLSYKTADSDRVASRFGYYSGGAGAGPRFLHFYYPNDNQKTFLKAAVLLLPPAGVNA